jgi:hypothetical protein
MGGFLYVVCSGMLNFDRATSLRTQQKSGAGGLLMFNQQKAFVSIGSSSVSDKKRFKAPHHGLEGGRILNNDLTNMSDPDLGYRVSPHSI